MLNMKRSFICVLVLSVVFLLTACTSSEEVDWVNGGGLLNLDPTGSSVSTTEHNRETTNPTDFESSDPVVTDPTEPDQSEPLPTDSAPTEPLPTELLPTEPLPTEPEVTEPLPTEPEVTEPKPTEPLPTESKPTEPPHKHTYTMTKKVEADCTNDGYEVHTCSGCGKSYTDGRTKKMGHAYGDWEEIAREGIDITERCVCSRCSDTKTRQTLDYPEGDYTLSIVNGAYISKAQQDACARKIYEITNPWLEQDLSDFEKAQNAFIYLRENVTYLQDFDKFTSSHYGALINGQADCWGYCNAYQYLCHALGLNCYVVGWSDSMHKWNIVELDGICYHVDAQVGCFLRSDAEEGINDSNREWEYVCPQETPYGNKIWWW